MNRASSSAGKAPPHNQPPRQSPGRFCVWRGRIVRERKGSIRPCGARQRHAPIRCHGRREAVRRETIRRRFAPGEPAASARRRRKLPRKGRLQQKVAAALGKRCEERRASCPVDDGQVYFGLGERLLRQSAALKTGSEGLAPAARKYRAKALLWKGKCPGGAGGKRALWRAALSAPSVFVAAATKRPQNPACKMKPETLIGRLGSESLW